ncbi:iron-sulfur cluster insertion protein ErpA [Novispirillum sp. DQ9]|uniref:iron-sulfur cluster insertion protein ErpA n=1 Tax=Novispirillum sp. DQ9 TaxID=3398612 RepID=UPI003C7E845B
MTATTATPDTGVALTANAAARVRTLMEAEGNPALMLRVTVSGGGCSGFQYGFDLDTATRDDDVVLEQHGVKVVIDEASLDLLRGSEIDFVEDLMAAAFTIRNPQATSTCGCGNSFAL